MKYLATSVVLAAVLASSTMVAASTFDQPNVPDVVRRHAHKRHNKTCSTKHKSSKSNKASSSTSSSSAQSNAKSNVKSNLKTSSGSGSSSSSSSSSNSSSSSKSGSADLSGGKMGLCWANADGMPINNFDFGSVSWFYSWSTTPGWDSAPVDKLMYCPMLWGQKNVGDFQNDVLNNQNSKWNQHKCVMGMNEVNQQGQADLSASDGCKMMEQYIMPLKEKGWYVMGPSVTNAPDGKTWYQDFKSTCPDVFNKLDSIALHYYGTSASDFKSYLEDWHTTFGKDIWVTEFACQNFSGGAQCDKDQTNSFANEVSTYMNGQSWVKGWAPFAVIQNLQGVSETQRLSNGNNPTSLFQTYANAN